MALTVEQQTLALLASMQKLLHEQSKSAKSVMDLTRQTTLASDALENLAVAGKNGRNLTEDELKMRSELSAAMREEQAALRRKQRAQEQYDKLEQDHRNKTAAQQAIDLSSYQTQRATAASQLTAATANHAASSQRVTTLTNIFNNSIGRASNGLNILVGVLSLAGKSILSFNNNFLSATTKSSGVIESASGTFDESMNYWNTALGLSTGVLGQNVLAIMAENRQMVNAMGGIRNVINTAGDSIEDMRGFYGGLEESMTATTGIMTSFATSGVKASKDTLVAYNKDLTLLSKQTGMAPTAINAMIDSISSDVDSMSILKNAREGEREAILANQRALLTSNIALGMTAKQAEAAGKMLNKMVAQKPLDRLKQAAKMRAMGAALGLGPESEKAARAVSAGKNATNEQIKDLRDFSVKATGLVDTAARQGIGQELFVTEMLDKLDLSQYYGSGSVFSATLGDVMRQNTEETNAMYQTSSDSNIIALNNIADIALEALNTLISGQLIWSGLYSLINLLGDKIGGLATVIVSGVERFINDFQMLLAKLLPTWIGGGSEKEASLKAERKTIDAQHDFLVKNVFTTHTATEKNETQLGFVPEDLKKESVARHAREREKEKNDKEALSKMVTPTPPAAPVKVEPTIAQANAEKTTTDRSYATAQFHTDLLTDQNNKIDQQLANMKDANLYLKTMAEVVPKLLDTAEKQLAVSTMTQDQKDKAAKSLGSWNAKFSADYSYGAA